MEAPRKKWILFFWMCVLVSLLCRGLKGKHVLKGDRLNNWLPVASRVAGNCDYYFLSGMLMALEALMWQVMCHLRLWYFMTQIVIFRKCVVSHCTKFPFDHQIDRGFRGEGLLLPDTSVCCEVGNKGSTQ